MIGEARGGSWPSAPGSNGRKEKDLPSYKAVHERTPPKPGFKLWCNGVANVFYWSDLSRVVFDPTPDDSDEEALSLIFHNSTMLVLRGHRLSLAVDDFQSHRVDVIRLSSQDLILRRGNEELLITGIQILTPSKAQGRKKKTA
jgi:hypothetical protein